MTMHVVLLCNEYPPGYYGGIGSSTRTLGRALVRRGHQVTVLGVFPPGREGREEDGGVRVIRLAHTSMRGMGFLAHRAKVGHALKEIHAESPIDVIEAPENGLAMVPRALRVPTVIRMHGGHHFFARTLGKEPRPVRGWLERRSFARADHLCAVSRFVAETTRDALGLGPRPIEILPNSVDTTLFRPMPEVPEDHGRVLFVGGLCEKKGVRQLLQAMPAVARAVPDARLTVVGADRGDPATGRPFMDTLRPLVTPELAGRVEFLGPVPNHELPRLLAAASVCAYPSHMESQGIVYLEAMAMGKAVVASRTGPGPEVVEDGATGLLCDPHDPASIAGKVVALLRDPDLRARLGAAAAQRARDLFSADEVIRRNEDFYAQCATAGVND